VRATLLLFLFSLLGEADLPFDFDLDGEACDLDRDLEPDAEGAGEALLLAARDGLLLADLLLLRAGEEAFDAASSSLSDIPLLQCEYEVVGGTKGLQRRYCCTWARTCAKQGPQGEQNPASGQAISVRSFRFGLRLGSGTLS
jgi:hypothetical protein